MDISEQIKRFKDLSNEILEWSQQIGAPQNHTRLSLNIKVYFAKSYKIATCDMGIEYMPALCVNNYAGEITFPENATDLSLDNLYVQVCDEFKSLKEEKQSELIESLAKQKEKRKQELLEELELLK